MNEKRKSEIIEATLALASEIGLGNVSMSMIAQKVGIKKPSLYNHFSSKDELVEETYRYLRERALKNAVPEAVDYLVIGQGETAYDILKKSTDNYLKMCADENMRAFYKIVYSERTVSKSAAKILVEETEKMIGATKLLFGALEKAGLMKFKNAEYSAMSFAFTVHGLSDLENDRTLAEAGAGDISKTLDEYIRNFCAEHSCGE